MTILNVNPDQDTFLNQNAPTGVNGGATTIRVQAGTGTTERQGLIRFDISSIPAGSTVNSATLTFNVTAANNAGQITGFHKMLAAWDESSTWDSMTGGISDNDVEAESATDFTREFSSTGSHEITVPAAAIQDWVDGQTNHGWALLAQWATNHNCLLESSEGTTQPVLSIDYTEPASGVTGTAAAALQVLGAAASGEVIFAGTSAAALQHAVAAAAGRAEAQGAAAAALQHLAADADGHHSAFRGAAAAAIQPLAAAAAGELIFLASAVAALQHLAGAAVGRAEAQAVAATAIQHLVTSASGAFAAGFSGSAAAALQHLIAAADGARAIEAVTGVAACTVTGRQEPWDDGEFWDDGTGWYEEGLIAEASGIFAQGSLGSSAAALQHLVASASSSLVPAGDAAVVLEILQAAAEGRVEAQGAAAVELQHLIARAFGQHGDEARRAQVSLVQRLSMNRLSWRN